MLPANVTLAHLARAARQSVDELLDVVRNPGVWYKKSFTKRVGKKKKRREIDPPTFVGKFSLQGIGRFIANELPVHPCAHGAVKKRCGFTAAAMHLGSRAVCTRDALDCFPNVNSDRFFEELIAVGLHHDVAVVLTELLLHRKRLPQGSPASNAALNLFFYLTDEHIRAAVAVFGGRYTRNCDDLVVSVPVAGDADRAAAILEEALARLGLSVNAEKRAEVGYQGPDDARHVNGVRVDTGCTELPASKIAHIFGFARRYELAALSCNLDAFSTVLRRRRRLAGFIGYASQAQAFPMADLKGILRRGDQGVLRNMRRYGVALECNAWWAKCEYLDSVAERRVAYAATRGRPVPSVDGLRGVSSASASSESDCGGGAPFDV